MVESHYTLSQITGHLQKLIARAYVDEYWVKAEIAKLNYYPHSGHCYPDLVEKDDVGIKAQMRSIIWAFDYRQIRSRFEKVTGTELGEGMEVLLKAKIDFSPQHGLTLRISDIDPDFTLGKMAAAKKQSIEKLKREGFFFMNKKLNFPIFPKRIAVISVETSKGYQDFINIINNNSRGYRFSHLLFPAILQGDSAVESIMNQLLKILRIKHHFDLVAIIRGGGGDVGLSCYNDFELAKMVATFPIPVVSGIGHSTNETVVEMVSHLDSITPTDLAYFLQQKFDNLLVFAERTEKKVTDLANRYLLNEFKKMERSAEHIQIFQKVFLDRELNILENFLIMLGRDLSSSFEKFDTRLSSLGLQASRGASNQLKSSQIALAVVNENMNNHLNHRLKSELIIQENLGQKIELMKPENLLKRGFSITLKNGNSIKDASQLVEGDEITTIYASGQTKSIIKKISK